MVESEQQRRRMNSSDCEDKWGCVMTSHLFASPAKTPSLNSLVRQILKKSSNFDEEKCEFMDDDRPFPISTANEWNLVQPEVSNGQMSTTSNSPTSSLNGSKKILKHKNGLVEKVPNLKRVTFEVGFFLKKLIK